MLSRISHFKQLYEIGASSVVKWLRRLQPAGWTRQAGHPYDTLLRQMYRHFAGGGGWAVWRPGGWAIRRPKEYRLKVDAATRCCGACSH